MCLENLSDVHIKKHEQAQKESLNDANRQKAIDYLNQALAILKEFFPSDSPHIKRIQNKLDRLKKDESHLARK